METKEYNSIKKETAERNVLIMETARTREARIRQNERINMVKEGGMINTVNDLNIKELREMKKQLVQIQKVINEINIKLEGVE